MTWLSYRTVALFEMLHAPEAAFDRDLRGPSYLIPLLILGVLFTLIAVSQAPYQLQWTQNHLESAGTPPEQVSAAMEIMRRSSTWSFVGVPVTLLLRWTVYAALLWLVAQLALQLIDFQQALTIVAFSYVPFLFRDGITGLVIYLRGTEALSLTRGLYVPLGLDLLFPEMKMPWASLAANVNLFEAWFVLLLVVGVAKLTRSHWRKALAVVLPCWIIVVLLQFGLLFLATTILK